MNDSPQPPVKAWPRVRGSFLAVVLLLTFYAVTTFCASLHKGPAFDEGEHLFVGYANWHFGDFRMEAANGDLTKRWASLPLLVSRPYFPDVNTRFWRGGEAYDLAFLFFFRSSNAAEWMLLQGRTMMIVFGLGTGLLIFFCARELFGTFGGLLSLAAFVISPNMLAFGAHVGTSMPVCLTMLASLWCIWHLLHRVTWGWLIASPLCLGLLFLAKPSGFAILPIAAVLVLIKVGVGRPLVWAAGKTRTFAARRSQWAPIAALVVIHAGISWAMIWANYDFRFAASSNPENPALTFKVQETKDPVNPALDAFVDFSHRAHFLPEGFLEGLRLLMVTDDWRQTFLNGEWKIGGWRYFFPYAIWAKTSPALLLLLLIAAAGWWWVRKRHPAARPAENASASSAWPPEYGAIPYVVLIVVYLIIASMQNINIGHRHLLPAYPGVYILIGSIALAWPWWRKWARSVIALLFLWHVTEAVSLYPNYLAYFSPFVGGPSQGYKHLVDSSLDWGMDLPGFKEWLDEHNPNHREQVYLAYFGTDSTRYHDIRTNRLPGFPDWLQRRAYGLTPGIYAISATLFQSLYTKTFGPWNEEYEKYYQIGLHNMLLFESTANDPARRAELLRSQPPAFWESEYDKFEKLRFGRLCAWLRHSRPPDDEVGYSILIWRLNGEELREALFGPPPELGPVTPGVIVPVKSSGKTED